MSLKLKISTACLLGLCFLSVRVYAADTLEDILTRHIIQKPTKIAYTQTQYHQFLDQPIRATGFIFLESSHFVMQQDAPQPLLVSTDHKQVWLYNINQDRRYKKNISRFGQKDPALAALIAALRFGQISELKKQFEIKEVNAGLNWVLEMQPQHYRSKKLYKNMVLQGQEGQRVDALEIHTRHGNRIVWQFEPQVFSDDDLDLLQFLKQQAQGS